jgi:hypothetical protein
MDQPLFSILTATGWLDSCEVETPPTENALVPTKR